jgi:hypothetical protein
MRENSTGLWIQGLLVVLRPARPRRCVSRGRWNCRWGRPGWNYLGRDRLPTSRRVRLGTCRWRALWGQRLRWWCLRAAGFRLRAVEQLRVGREVSNRRGAVSRGGLHASGDAIYPHAAHSRGRQIRPGDGIRAARPRPRRTTGTLLRSGNGRNDQKDTGRVGSQ